ncbi:methyltransferase domain-containing protein [Desulfobacter curvatus]|uniref:methyltransferase domain-containing protein n=1 Tax=Desulfobacter curvatus TaxID=2290 RepID=UPI0003706507|nr:methyltransferase domain-containing protein [Desulfobacter curvatus]
MLTRKSLLDAVRREQVLYRAITLKDVLNSSGETFIYRAFEYVLGREPDPPGRENYLSKLASGELTKEKILLILRFSDEGKRNSDRMKWSDLLTLGLRLLKPSKSLPPSPVPLNYTTTGFGGLSDHEYADFEAHFRGSVEDVRRHLKVYTPVILDLQEQCGSMPVKGVDLGCGRGEWLELLKEYEVAIQGVDLNDTFFGRVQEKNLSVVKSDIFEYLKASKPESFDLVTAFHVIEHIPPDLRMAFLRQILRVLRKDGVCILETPNPRNLLVGCGDFYRDPTHIAPIFPDTIEFQGKIAGFSQSAAYFIQDRKLLETGKYRFDTLDHYVQVSRDFAWMGKK